MTKGVPRPPCVLATLYRAPGHLLPPHPTATVS